MNTPGKKRKAAKNSEYSVKKLLFEAAAGVIAERTVYLLGRILYRVSGGFNEFARKVSHGLILPVLILLALLSVLLILSYAAFRLYHILKKPPRKHKKARLVTRISGLAGLIGLTALAAIFAIRKNTPFQVIALNPVTVHEDTAFVLKQDVSDLWVKIAGTSTDLSVEIDWRPSRERDRDILFVSGLQKDRSIEQSFYFRPAPGSFRVSRKVLNVALGETEPLAPGDIRAGGSLILKTKRTSGFEGEILFEFWDSPQEGAGE